ncbi:MULTISPECIES: hypothetical protein [unclassified Arthrobacter]|uniref:hypothetical protein n=1 Tax=unclassified Arthrobacter TaxID=235627 RepID=UPI001F1DEB3E|nr:hypothetical protein [Arthrobacter sp. Soil764]
MSVLVTFTEVSPPSPGAAVTYVTGGLLQFPLDGTIAPQGEPAVHCGAAMHLVTPAVGWEGASYTFGPTDTGSVELPPVWRCACGFQLDAWPAADVSAPRASVALSA